MEDNKELENTQQEEEQREEKTFTQDEVDEIIKKRLARERRRLETGEEVPVQSDREKDLDARENVLYAKERFMDERFPDDLMELVSGKNREDIDKTIKILKPYIDKLKEPIMNPVGPAGSGGSTGVDAIRSAMGFR